MTLDTTAAEAFYDAVMSWSMPDTQGAMFALTSARA
jgi:hypothetical protein